MEEKCGQSDRECLSVVSSESLLSKCCILAFFGIIIIIKYRSLSSRFPSEIHLLKTESRRRSKARRSAASSDQIIYETFARKTFCR